MTLTQNNFKSKVLSVMSNPVALITGAAKRIGKATTETLHQQGFNVIIHCHKSTAHASELAHKLNSERSNSAHVIVADLLDIEGFADMARQVTSQFGRLDLLINNASSFYPNIITESTVDQWDDLMTTNLKAPFFLIQALKNTLEKNNGCVINMVDIHAERPLLGYSIYCMAKAGLAMLTKSLSRELAPNIRVNGVAPGAILWHENDLSEADKRVVLSEVALNRLGSPQDIADAIMYLVNAPYVTGQIIAVDGGRSVNGGAKA